MRKYWQIFKINFQEYLVYRLNFILWRFRSFVLFLTLLLFWLAIYGDNNDLLGYQKSQMIAYMIGFAFLRSIVLATTTGDLAGQIKSGDLTQLIIRPMKMLPFWFISDLVDKAFNFGFMVVEVGLVLFLLKSPFYFPQKIETYFFFLILVLLAVLLNYFINFLLSIFAFWTEDVWATRWLFAVILLQFFAGAYFPLDILPAWLTKIIYLTPFPYLIFFPLKVWLEQVSGVMILKTIFICGLWTALAYWLAKFLWRKGIKNYGAYGH